MKKLFSITFGLVVIFLCNYPVGQPDGDERLLLDAFQKSFDAELESSYPDSALSLALAVLELKNEKLPPLTFVQAAMQAGIVY
jgi:hypothetical protein